MNVIRTISDAEKIFTNFVVQKKTIGFVPTMGALHLAHEKLIQRAILENNISVVSIFVNPLQFGPKEDFKSYPKPFNNDLKICKKLGVDFVFAPSIKEMYPDTKNNTIVSVKKYTNILCDKFRPGHFDGVATVVTKLFNIIHPTRAYFGQKDYQQLLIIQQLVKDLNMKVTIVPMETFREQDGLAYSSRNKYLSKKERLVAPVIYKSLLYCKQLLKSRNFKISECIKNTKSFLHSQITVPHKIQYLEIYDKNLQPVNDEVNKIPHNTELRIFIAIYIGKTRLIDNVSLNL
ncbi:MAG: pantoate--beta-alanine ligase [Endomicrobiia bacterium]